MPAVHDRDDRKYSMHTRFQRIQRYYTADRADDERRIKKERDDRQPKQERGEEDDWIEKTENGTEREHKLG